MNIGTGLVSFMEIMCARVNKLLKHDKSILETKHHFHQILPKFMITKLMHTLPVTQSSKHIHRYKTLDETLLAYDLWHVYYGLEAITI